MPRRLSRFLLALGVLSAASCNGEGDTVQDFDPGPTPTAHFAGEALYDVSCSSCHGPQARGGLSGPPLVHSVYEPNHHADITFHRAVELGVVAHHWSYGPMPPVEGLEREQVDQIIGYVRWLQRQAGIY